MDAAECQRIIDAMPRPEDPVAKWKREADEFTRKQDEARAALKASETEIIRQRQEAAERSAMPEMPEMWIDVIGGALAELRKQLRAEFAEQLGQLRAELTKHRGVEPGGVVRKIRIRE
jgi:hypothetical protein